MEWMLWFLLKLMTPEDSLVLRDAPATVIERGGKRDYVSQEGVKVEGTLVVGEADYPLKHVAVVETDVEKAGVDRIHVAVSSKPIRQDRIAEIRDDDGPTALFEPSVVVSFTRKGKAVRSFAWADNHNDQGWPTSGEIRLEAGRLKGFAKLEREKEKHRFGSNTEYDFTFDVPVPEGFAGLKESEPEQAPLAPVAHAEPPQVFSPFVVPPVRVGSRPAERAPTSLNGQFTLVSTPQGAVRMDTRTGESWLLKISDDGGKAEWVAIQGPAAAPPPAPPADLQE